MLDGALSGPLVFAVARRVHGECGRDTSRPAQSTIDEAVVVFAVVLELADDIDAGGTQLGGRVIQQAEAALVREDLVACRAAILERSKQPASAGGHDTRSRGGMASRAFSSDLSIARSSASRNATRRSCCISGRFRKGVRFACDLKQEEIDRLARRLSDPLQHVESRSVVAFLEADQVMPRCSNYAGEAVEGHSGVSSSPSDASGDQFAGRILDLGIHHFAHEGMFLHHGTYRVKSRSLAVTAGNMNALRHVTYRAAQPWISEEDLVLTKTLGERIRYVRENLVNDEGIGMTQPQLASLVGLAPGHHGIGGWETRGREPKDPARHKLSQLTGGEYRPAVFSRSGAEVLVKEFAVPRLQSLEVEMET